MRFVLPDESALRSTANAAESYAILNYCGRGLVPAIKRNRFQRALDLGGAEAARKVIDMGCADGGTTIDTIGAALRHVRDRAPSRRGSLLRGIWSMVIPYRPAGTGKETGEAFDVRHRARRGTDPGAGAEG